MDVYRLTSRTEILPLFNANNDLPYSENDEVWIGTKERTDKVPMSSIKAVVSEPIDGHLGFHMVALQLGPTEASRYWIYWVPSQYVDAIKRTILG